MGGDWIQRNGGLNPEKWGSDPREREIGVNEAGNGYKRVGNESKEVRIGSKGVEIVYKRVGIGFRGGDYTQRTG